jgi:hypothetical protein
MPLNLFQLIYKEDNCWEAVYTSNVPPKNRCRHTGILYKNNIIIFGGNDSDRSFNDVNVLKMRKIICVCVRGGNNIKLSNILQNLKFIFKKIPLYS